MHKDSLFSIYSLLFFFGDTHSDKAYLVKAMVSPVVMYGCERRTIKKAEHQGIDTFEL